MKKTNLNDLYPLILSPPIDNIGNEELWSLFGQVLSLKVRGYGREYPDGTLPADTTDLYAHHFVVAEKQGGKLRPLSSYKAVDLSRSDYHRHTFPAFSLVDQAKAPLHREALQIEIDRCRKNQRRIAYCSSWTIDPEVRGDQALHRYLKETFCGFYMSFLSELGVDETIVGGTLRFKTDVIFQRLGHRPLSLDGSILPPIHVSHLFNENVLVMHMREKNEECRRLEKEARLLWNRKLFLGTSEIARKAA
ncbi:MAG TPA: hypothetical protein PL182_09385 [Pseudobdellovibrionaceae bacterium]|nr:hypothetical protein [Pseudobdellovibrionaceae bacterium]